MDVLNCRASLTCMVVYFGVSKIRECAVPVILIFVVSMAIIVKYHSSDEKLPPRDSDEMWKIHLVQLWT